MGKIRRSLALIAMALIPILAPQRAGAEPQRKAVELVRPRTTLQSFEVYHIDDYSTYRSAVSLEELISTLRARDYARIQTDNTFSVDALYRALNDTAVSLNANCETDRIDVRWAIVLNYTDHTKDVIGFNRIVRCIKLLSRKDPVAATDGLIVFVDRTFGFMR